MASRRFIRDGMHFEVWNKSLRMVHPTFSPMFASYSDLNDEENLKKALDDFVAIMNIGIEIHSKRRLG